MREGVRKVEAMAPFVKDLKDEDIQALADHFRKVAAEAERRSDRPGAAPRKGRRLRRSGAAIPVICRRSPASSRCRGWRSSASTT